MKPTLSFTEAISTCFNKYADFNGRARRSEFWWFYLLGSIPGWINYAIQLSAPSIAISIIFGIIGLALLIPYLAVWVRRLHDTGRSGHWLWFILLCGIGILVPLIMCIFDGQPGANQYGSNPKED